MVACVLAFAAPAQGATIEVTTTNDEITLDGDCSLREAVEVARGNAAFDACPKGKANETDVIVLAPGTYALDLATTNESNNQNGDLDVTGGGPIKFKGAGAGDTEITTSLDDRILEAFAATSVKLQSLAVSGGEGGGSPADGGNVSILGGGKLGLKNVTMLNGTAPNGGNINMSNDSRFKMVKSTLAGGTATQFYGGGIRIASSSTATIKKSTLAANDVAASAADGSGGAIYLDSESSLEITDTDILGNEVNTTGLNEAEGGGILSQGELTVKRSLVAGNDANAAVGAESEVGGGIFHVSSDPALIVNTTLANNAAADLGGAYYTNSATTAMSHVTFSNNDAAAGDHLFAGTTALVKLANSIVPSALSGDACETPSDTIRSKGYNLFNLQDPDCPVKDTDEVVSDVGLDPDGLEDNGGFTSTIAIQKSSEAVNLVPLKKCGKSDGEDQRGFKRPAGNRCDAGAFERGAKP